MINFGDEPALRQSDSRLMLRCREISGRGNNFRRATQQWRNS